MMLQSWRCALVATGLVAVTALLCACGDRAGGTIVPATVRIAGHTLHSRTFKYLDAKQYFIVPSNVTRLAVVIRGAKGGGGYGAYGGRIHAVIPVTPGEHLVVLVGGEGLGHYGGYNGGGAGGDWTHCSKCAGEGGGGASDVRRERGTLADRILVAAGGGGQGAYAYESGFYGMGGAGGGREGDSGRGGAGACAGDGGTGGTQTAGGAGGLGGKCQGYGGNRGSNGARGAAGAGASIENKDAGYGGGGGGGYYGGGGGGSSTPYSESGGGGGGGGSNYVEPSAINSHSWRDWKNATGNGLVVFSWTA